MTQISDADVTLKDSDQKHSLIILALSMLISATGTNIILVALSVNYFQETASAVGAAGVYVAQFLPIFLLMPVAWRLCDRVSVRSGLVSLELGACVATISVGLAVSSGLFGLAYALLFIRGFFDMTTKVARNVALKTYLDNARIDRANNLVMICNYVGQALGALIGFLLIALAPIHLIALINGATYVISAFICLSLIAVDPVRTASGGYIELFKRGRNALMQNHAVRHAMAFLVFSVVFLQAFNQVARVWIPLGWLNLPPEFGAMSEAVGVAGIVLGVLVVHYRFSGDRLLSAPLFAIFIIASVTMVGPFLTKVPALTFLFYFLFMFMFEVSFMISMNRVLKISAREDVPCLMVMFYGLAFGGMAITTLLIGFTADIFKLPTVSIAVLLIAIITSILLVSIDRVSKA